jgi:hypothetical protein
MSASVTFGTKRASWLPRCRPSDLQRTLLVGRSTRDPPRFEPCSEVSRIEPEQVSPLKVGDPSLEDQPANVSYGHSEVVGNLVDVEQSRQRRHVTHVGHYLACTPRRTLVRHITETITSTHGPDSATAWLPARLPKSWPGGAARHLHVCLRGPVVAGKGEAVARREAPERGPNVRRSALA